jgi:hypothetical protein
MREQEMAVNVAKQIYFDEFNLFYQIAERSIGDTNSKDVFNEACTVHDITEEFMYRLNDCNSYTKEGLNQERIIAIYKALHKIDGYFSDERIKCYIEYTDKIIDEILKQVAVLGGGD